MSRAKVVGRQIGHEIQQLQKRLAQQERVLGDLDQLISVRIMEIGNVSLVSAMILCHEFRHFEAFEGRDGA